MKKAIHLLTCLLCVIFITSACKDNNSTLSSDNQLVDFVIYAADNPNLDYDIYYVQDGNKFSARVPLEQDLNTYKATFTTTGAKVWINENEVTSKESLISFADDVELIVEAEDGSQNVYTIQTINFTGLPVVFINTEGAADITSKEDYLDATIEVNGNHLFDNLTGEIKIKGRGNSTWWVSDKKPYQIKFDDKTEILGMPKDKKWVLLANYSDKTKIRNSLALEIGRLSDLDYTPQAVYCELYLNGQHRGLYQMAQKVEESKNRVNIDDEGFLLEVDQLDRLDPDDVYFYAPSGNLFNVKEPGIDWDSEEHIYIKNYITEVENALYGENFKNPNVGYAKYLDVDSYVDWYLVNEISKNVDAIFYSSVYMNHIPGEKLKMGPIWDFDLGFGNTDYSDSQYPTGFYVKNAGWFVRLFQDPAFVAKVKSRFQYYNSHREDLLTFVNQQSDKLFYSRRQNNLVWKTLGVYVWPNPVVFNTFTEEDQYLISWFNERMDWLDTAFGQL